MRWHNVSMVLAFALLSMGCGLSAYENRLEASLTRLEHDRTLDEKLRPDPWVYGPLKIGLRPPIYMRKAKEPVYGGKGKLRQQGARDAVPPFMELPHRVATFRGRTPVSQGNRGEERHLYLYIAGLVPQGGQSEEQEGEEGGAAADLNEQVLDSLEAAIQVRPELETLSVGGSGFAEPITYDYFWIEDIGEYPFVVQEEPFQESNLPASLQGFFRTDEKQGKQVALLVFGPKEMFEGKPPGPNDINYCLETLDLRP